MIIPELTKAMHFTTKATGTGLGLTSAFTIIQRHEGVIGVDSKVGQGTTFEIYLLASSHQDKAEEKEPDEVIDIPKQEGHILVMDDEPIICVLIEHILKEIGCSVTSTSRGEELIDLYRQGLDSNKPFDAVILDLTIPGGPGGKETIEQLHQIDPNV